MKYQCPHCRRELNDNDVMSSKCPSCFKIFNRPLVISGNSSCEDTCQKSSNTTPKPSISESPIVFENNSGQGPSAAIPDEIRKWNWGAFYLHLIWSICNNVWIGLLMLIPIVAWIMPFILGAKGNEWAWQNKRWDSVEHFLRVQRNWSRWGLVFCIFILIVVLSVLAAIGYSIGEVENSMP